MRYSGLIAAFYFAGGILLANAPFWGAVCLFVCLLANLRKGGARLLSVGFGVAGFGAAMIAASVDARPVRLPRHQPIEIVGTVEGFPKEREWATEVRLRVDAFRSVEPGETGRGWRPENGLILLRFAPGMAPSTADRIAARTELRAFRNLGLPGEFDREAYARSQRLIAQGRVNQLDWRIVERGGGLRRALAEVRQRLWLTAARQMDTRAAGVFSGLALGEKSRMPNDLQEAWRNAGVSHLVTVSGLHIGMIFLVAAFIIRQLLGRVPALCHRAVNLRAVSSYGALPFACLYALLSGGQAPAMRALAMLAILLFAQALGRRTTGLDKLGWAGAALLAADPRLLYAAGFQLSFCAVMGAMAWARRSTGKGAWLVAAIWSTLTATAWTFPVASYHFGQTSLSGLVANLPLIPFVSLVLTPGAFFLAAVSLMFDLPLLWHGFGFLCNLANRAAEFFAELPGAVLHLRLDGVESAAAAGGLLLLTVIGGAGRHRFRAAAAGLVLIMGLGGYEWVRLGDRDVPLRVDVLSIGQGDAILVSARGRHMLVDTGGTLWSDNEYERTLRPYLIAQRVRSLDYLVLSHPHEDHVGAAAGLINEWRPSALVVSDEALYRKRRPDIINAAKRAGVAIEAWQTGREVAWAGLTLTTLHPSAKFLAEEAAQRNVNEGSIVLRVAHGQACVLLAGDAEHAAEKHLLSSLSKLECSLLKVGHHGSRTSSTPRFLAAVKPQYALISSGFRNQFRHPHAQTLSKLDKSGAQVYVTADSGTLTALWGGGQWQISSSRSRRRPKLTRAFAGLWKEITVDYLDFAYSN